MRLAVPSSASPRGRAVEWAGYAPVSPRTRLAESSMCRVRVHGLLAPLSTGFVLRCPQALSAMELRVVGTTLISVSAFAMCPGVHSGCGGGVIGNDRASLFFYARSRAVPPVRHGIATQLASNRGSAQPTSRTRLSRGKVPPPPHRGTFLFVRLLSRPLSKASGSPHRDASRDASSTNARATKRRCCWRSKSSR